MIRFGVIGTNWITESFLDAATEVKDFSLTSVYSRTEEKAKEFADKHQATHTYTEIEEFAKSEEFDAVYIASPNSYHAEQAILCMNYGKHVIIEKSIASNAKEVESIIEAAEKNGVVVMEALKTTFLPNFQAIKENLHKIGTVRRYFASYCQYSSRYDAYKEGTILNAFNPKFSNGSLMDIGVYCTYPMVALFGKPNKLLASSFLLDSGVDGQGSIMFEYDEMSGVVMYSKIANSYIPSEIQGEKGSILIDNFNSPTHVEIRYKDGTTEDITREQVDNTMYYEAKAFIETIQSGKKESDVNSLEQSLITAQLLEEARKQTGVVFPADQ
ncbi:Gfo/Idh/MocA family oxidoreductase [Radiobacillus kanasensis]|uniref:Gfo/Idh/MocA family protein n=1 Tax=Radiobacillus kanasensis TaxID=2844358 RepID=UPI001E2A0992|nr:Gfo/Idh/MocA family oxidoreductase [Radiobacillus kanasensis]UFT99921.1 Gfo/Idh/MocA family oxidoreductase [Radiobacillus kanasensis]